MINFFVEKKNEYTINLVNVLSPLVYEGLVSIYTEALNVSNSADNILKVFQSFLKKIPKWTSEMINQETERILKNSKSCDWLSNLVKATIKSNMIILTYNPHLKLQNKIESSYYKNINLEGLTERIKGIKNNSTNQLFKFIEDKIVFDFIYIDGSHLLLDCYTDIVLAWKMLEKGGIMGIDDYTYKKKTILESPFEAINHFLKKYVNEYRLIHKGYRVFIEKK